jgi:hypothetical protein
VTGDVWGSKIYKKKKKERFKRKVEKWNMNMNLHKFKLQVNLSLIFINQARRYKDVCGSGDITPSFFTSTLVEENDKLYTTADLSLGK